MTDANNIDYERLFKVLTVRAAGLLRGEDRCVDMGVDALDLARETLDAFFSASNMLGWNPGKGRLEDFLAGVLHNKFRIHRRRDRKTAGSLDDPDGGFAPREPERSPEEKARYKELEEKLCEAVGDKDLRDFIAAVEWTTGGHAVNQELAVILGKSEREVVNLKRRLMNNGKVCELLLMAYGKGQAV